MLKIPEKIEYVLDRLTRNGFEAYIVGGCVRDMLMGAVPHDFDVTTSAKPEDVIGIFEKTVPTGIKHGTVTVIIEKTPIEVTTFRTEGIYIDHRRPENVEFVTELCDDLSRRDFTVNAMAYNPNTGLCDYFGGQLDLENKVLKAVGDPEVRFQEDALRILRLFRFASVLGFECEENTLKAALKCAYLLEAISRERIMNELSKAVTGKNLKAIAPLIECGALEFLGIEKCPSFKVLENIKENADLSLLAFLYLSGANVQAALSLLKASNAQKNYAKDLERIFLLEFPIKKSDLKLMLALSPKETVEDYLDLCEAFEKDVSFQRQMLDEITESNEPYLISHLKINGNDLRKMGFKGEQIGEILQRLIMLVIEYPHLNNEQDLKYEISRF